MKKSVNIVKTNKQMEGIDIRKFINMYLCPDESGNPVMKFTTKKNKYIFPLVTAFQVHLCNEFLHSLDSGIDIEFNNYEQYCSTIFVCGLLLEEKQRSILKKAFQMLSK